MASEANDSRTRGESSDLALTYRTTSVDHLSELQEDVDALAREGKLSDNRVYRGYLSELRFAVPETLPDARSIIVLAVFTRLMLVRFHLDGKTYEAMMPPQYYSSCVSAEDLRYAVLQEVIGTPGHEAERADRVHLKLLAVRSGLGRYGRNNLCYVDGMGSFLTLYAYFTDFAFDVDDWGEMRMMDTCRDCRVCMDECPCGCITEENAVIDVGRCLTLYNEIPGEFPGWIGPHDHNALVGCMRCQLCCPVNREAAELTGRLEDITEEEARKILEGVPDAELLASLSRKLRGFGPARSEEHFPVLTRNLRALLRGMGA